MNFYVQLYGHKRFLLFPPEDYHKLPLSPRLGPHYRQIQVDFSVLDTELYPEVETVTALEAILKPGDVSIIYLE